MKKAVKQRSEPKTRRENFRVTEGAGDMIDELAIELGQSKSQIFEEAIKYYYKFKKYCR